MTIQLNAAARLKADKWSAPVTEEIKRKPESEKPPEGLFTKDAAAIAQGLKKLHPDLKGASSALTFYRNRAGKNLSDADKKKLEDAQVKLHNLYPEKKD